MTTIPKHGYKGASGLGYLYLLSCLFMSLPYAGAVTRLDMLCHDLIIFIVPHRQYFVSQPYPPPITYSFTYFLYHFGPVPAFDLSSFPSFIIPWILLSSHLLRSPISLIP